MIVTAWTWIKMLPLFNHKKHSMYSSVLYRLFLSSFSKVFSIILIASELIKVCHASTHLQMCIIHYVYSHAIVIHYHQISLGPIFGVSQQEGNFPKGQSFLDAENTESDHGVTLYCLVCEYRFKTFGFDRDKKKKMKNLQFYMTIHQL